MEQLLEFVQKKQVYGIVIALLLAFLLYRLLNILISKIALKGKDEFDKKKKKTVIEILRNITKSTIIAITVIYILDLFGINVNSLVASLGIFSALAALSLQDTLKDVIGGAVIIMDNYYIVGDYVTFGDFTGQVIQIGIRTTKIMDADRRVLTISNRKIDQIINLSEKNASVLVEAPTAYEAKTEKVEKVLLEILEEIKTWPGMDKEKTSFLGITELGDSSVKYGIRFCCSRTKSWQYKRDLLRLIKTKYDANNIKIPYNQLEVHNGK